LQSVRPSDGRIANPSYELNLGRALRTVLPNGSSYRSRNLFTNLAGRHRGPRERARRRNHLQTGELVHLILGAFFSARCLQREMATRPISWKRWSGARTVGERFPPPLRSRQPRPCRAARVIERASPVLSACAVAMLPRSEYTTTLLPSPSRQQRKSANPH